MPFSKKNLEDIARALSSRDADVYIESLHDRLTKARTAADKLIEWVDNEPYYIGSNGIKMQMTPYRQGFARDLRDALAGWKQGGPP